MPTPGQLAGFARRGLGFLGDVERNAAGFLGGAYNSIAGFTNPAPPIGPVNPDVGPQNSVEEMQQGQQELAAIRNGFRPPAPPVSNLDPELQRQLSLTSQSTLRDRLQNAGEYDAGVIGSVFDPAQGHLGAAGSLLSPLNLVLPGAVAEQGVARVGAGLVGGIGAQQLADRALPEDTNPLVRELVDAGAAALGGGVAAKGVGGIIDAVQHPVVEPVPEIPMRPEGTVLTARIPGLPGAISATPSLPEAGTRPGALLNPRSLEQLGPDATVKDVIGVDRDLRRQVGSNAVSLMGEIHNASDTLGPTVQDSRGNIYLRDVILDSGAPALKQDVLENPDRYPMLTPEQRAAVDTYQQTAARVRNEALVFNAKTGGTAELEEGQNFIPRKVVTTTTGADTSPTTANPGGARLRGMSEKSRVFTDPLEASQHGVVYADPDEAIGQYVGNNLNAAAHQHVADMLQTFGKSEAERVNPDVRAAWEKVNGDLASVRDKLATAEKRAGIAVGRTDELDTALENMSRAQPEGGAAPLAKLPNAVDNLRDEANANFESTANEDRSFGAGQSDVLNELNKLVPDGTERVRFLDTAIARTERRIDVLANRGGAYAKTAAALRSQLDTLTAQKEKLSPVWKQALERARSTPPGEARVTSEAAPLLQGYSFDPADAKRINRYYNNGVLPDNTLGSVIKGVSNVSKKLIPMQAIGDASSLMRQLALVLPSHPIEFTKAAGQSFIDAFGGWKGYNEWLSSPEVRAAAKSGVELMGEGGNANTDMWAQWFEKVPGLKQTQRQFEASSNRMRVAIWNQDVDMLRRTGQPVDALTLEQTARNANRITGVSNARATDFETATEFAANYLRSRLETLTKAVSDGGVEGQLARGYLKNYVSSGLMVVTAAALAQGRDPREVLNPVTVDKQGRFHLNPNFGTVRVFGTDLNVFGTYSDLAAMSMTVADGAYGAIKERDAFQLSNAILQAARSKVGPAISLPWDLQSGRDAIGNPTHTWEYLLTRPLPIVGTQAIQAAQNGQSVPQQVFGGVANVLGARANPVTVTEQLGQAAQAKGFGSDFNTLTPEQQKTILGENPGLAQRREEQILNGTGPSAKYEAAKQRIAAQQVAGDDQFTHGALTLGQWHDLATGNAKALREAALESFPVGKTPDPSKPWELYYAQIDKATDKAGTVDWNKVEAWKASQPKTVQDAIDKNTGLNGTPVEAERSAVLKKLAADGYFNMPKYRGLRSLDSDGVDKAREVVTAARLADPRLAQLDFATAARYALRKDYTPTQIADAIHGGETAYANPAYVKYQKAHAGELAWLDSALTYQQIHAIAANTRRR